MVVGKRMTRRALRAARPLVKETPLDRPVVLTVPRVASQMGCRGHALRESMLAAVGIGTDDDEATPDHLRFAGAGRHGSVVILALICRMYARAYPRLLKGTRKAWWSHSSHTYQTSFPTRTTRHRGP